ncbi:FmdB family zinc ribbon protein [Herbiconiux daphne]|uniref:FmdB family transcriptional regulator n=1 Tax=Herbiconiux daphne TaxID=2970914 RepID=A0ABT2GXS2_9MICO|nr:FmdB family zinc ribbon protein [Herbiconiux daphne]MCS5732759.1 FmdB family transcriptional regulator [Herbiconiux daphne]
MPTYSYRCTECDNAFDIQQAFTDDTLTVCPVCGGKLRKVFSPVGVTFNGSGFYRTDSRAGQKSGSGSGGSGSGGSGAASSDSSSSSGGSGSGSGSSDSSGSKSTPASSPAPAKTSPSTSSS